jgi:hypothetical protein
MSTLTVCFEVRHSEEHGMSIVTSAVEPDLLSSLLLHWHK